MQTYKLLFKKFTLIVLAVSALSPKPSPFFN